MTRPRARFRSELDGLAELRSALVAWHTDPRMTSHSEPAFAGALGAPAAPSGGSLGSAGVADLADPVDEARATVVPLRPLELPIPAPSDAMDPVLPVEPARPAPPPTGEQDAGPPADEPAADSADGAELDSTEDDTEEPDELAEALLAPAAPDSAVADLVARAQAGEAEAFGLLYDRYVELVYRYIYYRVGGQALAEDLVSETFLRALRRIGSFSWQGRDFAAWLITIARNLVADHFKSGRYRLEVTTADMLDADRVTDGPEREVLDSITNATLLDAVRRLNAEQQECLVLRFLHGLSVVETAQAMGKTEGAIKALQFRAVRTLARLLPKEHVR